MARYLTDRTDRGDLVQADDPLRLVWYSTSCSFWTDDFDLLTKAGATGIPCCPKCHCVGFQTTASAWEAGVRAYSVGQPAYAKFIADHKNVCEGYGVLTTQLWQKEKERAAAEPQG